MAQELNISFRTVEGHRRRVFEKTKVGTIADLVEMAYFTEIFECNSTEH